MTDETKEAVEVETTEGSQPGLKPGDSDVSMSEGSLAAGGPLDDEPEATTDIVRHTGSAALPSEGEWQQMFKASEMLAASSIVPAAYRGKPGDVLGAIMAGRELGLGPIIAMNKIDMIEGRPALSAEVMVALVRRAGHSIGGSSTESHATAFGKRKDNGDEMRVEWSVGMAKRADLMRKKNWQRYPEAMLWARSVSQLCRQLFPDVLLGFAYTPDEITEGDFIEADVVEPSEAVKAQLHPHGSDDEPEWIKTLRAEGYSSDEILDGSNRVRNDRGKSALHDLVQFWAAPESYYNDFIAEIRAAAPGEPAPDQGDDVSDAEVVSDDDSQSGPCPRCDGPTYPADSAANWACSKCDWESYHDDPWKTGGEYDVAQVVKGFGEDFVALWESLQDQTVKDIIGAIESSTDPDYLRRVVTAERLGKQRKTAISTATTKLRGMGETVPDDPRPPTDPPTPSEGAGTASGQSEGSAT
jgi:hypothetical protein